MSCQRVSLKTGTNPHFIGAWQLSDDSLCTDLIDLFETRGDDQTPGVTGSGVDPSAKRSTDLTIRPNDLTHASYQAVGRYMTALKSCYLDYLDQWSFLAEFAPTMHIGNFNIQKYMLGGHFKRVHSERTSLATLHRLFAWMTYLNDVDEGGQTRFVHYDLSIQPRKGLTLIWPSEWTHAHAAQPVETGSKYVITGWMHFPDQPAP